VSDENKHKPLSSEELLAMLNKKHNKEADDMDDFEKEAFEGFSANIDPLKAGELMDEVNQSISKKVSNIEDKGSQKSRVIWFSAAASLVVILMVTIFYVKQNSQNSDTNLALNEPKNEQLIAPGMKPAESEVVTGEILMNEPALSEISPKQFNVPEKRLLEKSEALPTDVIADNEQVDEQINQNVLEETKSGEFKSGKDEDVTVTENGALADKLEVKKKEKTTREESELDNGYSFAQNTSSTASDEQKESGKKADMDSKNLSQKSQVRSKSNEIVTISAGVASKTSPAASGRADNEAANYIGGENAIKEFVKTYLKSDKLIGKYKIKALVSSEGSLKVKSIVQISTDACNCMDKIEKALNAMTNWHPALTNGTKTSSEIEFTISF
jgi:hypothetical protein